MNIYINTHFYIPIKCNSHFDRGGKDIWLFNFRNHLTQDQAGQEFIVFHQSVSCATSLSRWCSTIYRMESNPRNRTPISEYGQSYWLVSRIDLLNVSLPAHFKTTRRVIHPSTNNCLQNRSSGKIYAYRPEIIILDLRGEAKYGTAVMWYVLKLRLAAQWKQQWSTAAVVEVNLHRSLCPYSSPSNSYIGVNIKTFWWEILLFECHPAFQLKYLASLCISH